MTACSIRRPAFLLLAVFAASGLPEGVTHVARAADDFEQPPIRYSQATPDNPVSRLAAKVDARDAQLNHDAEYGYLRSLLTALQVPESSQTLVFSKTSLQRQRISPRSPRALYFNDEVYVGYCQEGEVLEISAADPRLGTVFYTLDQRPGDGGRPKFVRQTDNCLLCHGSSQTQYVPGHVLRSVLVDAAGQPILAAGTYRIDQTSPLEQRWGGWYVTGTHGPQKHLGNLVVRGAAPAPDKLDNAAGHNVTDLADRIDVSAYPTRHSDLAALMVLEHQTNAHNYLTRANFTARQAMYYQEEMNKALDKPADHAWESVERRIDHAARELVVYLLMSGEAPITHKLAGTSTFAAEFAARGPRDRRGRSLRDLDLERRLFKHSCSYLVYSPSFAALPTEVHARTLDRLRDVLSGADKSPEFQHLSADDRQAIREILIDTLPAYAAREKR